MATTVHWLALEVHLPVVQVGQSESHRLCAHAILLCQRSDVVIVTHVKAVISGDVGFEKFRRHQKFSSKLVGFRFVFVDAFARITVAPFHNKLGSVDMDLFLALFVVQEVVTQFMSQCEPLTIFGLIGVNTDYNTNAVGMAYYKTGYTVIYRFIFDLNSVVTGDL